MDVLAALGDAPTAAIAIVAILFGLVFAARGQRGERRAVAGAGAADEAAPTLLKVPMGTAGPAPETDGDGLRTMAVGEVGHGAIRLGRPERASAVAGAPAVPAEPEAVPAPAPDPEFAPTAEPAPPLGHAPTAEPAPAPALGSGPEPAAAASPAPEPDPEPEPAPEAAAVSEPESTPEPAPAAPEPPPPPQEPSAPASQPPPTSGTAPFRQGNINLRKPGGG